MFLVETTDLSKSFGDFSAVDHVSLRVPAGSVFGFLGPNGAGKSTTIRMLLGLIRPDRGRIRIFEHPLETHRMDILSRVGALVEAPSFYGHLTGRENLQVTCRLIDAHPSRVDVVLRLFEIHDAANKLARHYSLGMQQRLALALAMLGEPELLVLDEPTNGLDPAGIHEIRNLIRELPEKTGTTVFVSSHQLSEVEKIASHLAILASGQLLFQGSLEEFNDARENQIEVMTSDPGEALSLLRDRGFDAHLRGDALMVVPRSTTSVSDVAEILINGGHRLRALTERQPSLEESFMALTSTEGNEQ